MEELIFYGDDIKIGRFPEDTRLFYANPPENPALDPIKAIQNALDHPVGAEPLEKKGCEGIDYLGVIGTS